MGVGLLEWVGQGRDTRSGLRMGPNMGQRRSVPDERLAENDPQIAQTCPKFTLEVQKCQILMLEPGEGSKRRDTSRVDGVSQRIVGQKGQILQSGWVSQD